MHYVYALCDPRKPSPNPMFPREPLYIGKGSGNRYKIHVKEASGEVIPQHKNFLKIDRIREILEEGLEPVVVFLAKDLEREAAYELEKEWITRLGREGIDEGGILTNRIIDQRSLGGGKKGIRHNKPRSEEHRRKIRERKLGWEPSENTRELWSRQRKGRNLSSDTREKIGKAHSGERGVWFGKSGDDHPVFGFKHTEEERRKRADRKSEYFSKEENRVKLSEKLARQWQITTPYGDTIVIKNLRKYCIEHNVPYDRVRNSRRGWRCEPQ